MKIAQFITTVDDGGAETIVLSLSQELIRNGHEVEIHARRDSWIYQRAGELNITRVMFNRNMENNLSVKRLPIFGWHYSKVLRAHDIDVVHSHCYHSTLRAAAASFFSKCKHVSTQHDTIGIEKKPKRTMWLNLASQFTPTTIAFISRTMKDFFVECGFKYSNKENKDVVYNGVDIQKFAFSSNKRGIVLDRHNLNEGNRFLVNVARLQKIKAQDLLLRAFKQANTDYYLFILGDGPERANLEELAEDLDISDKVIFTGAVNDVENYLSSAYAFVLPSHNEGLPCSIIEAMSAGLPVIATDVGGVKELLKFDNGYLIPKNNEEALVDAIRKLHSETLYSYTTMGTNSYRASSNFSLTKMALQYRELYT